MKLYTLKNKKVLITLLLVLLVFCFSISALAENGFQVGYSYGQRLKTDISSNINCFFKTVEEKGKNYQNLLNHAKLIENLYQEILPEKISWMKGLADATGISYEKILMFNTVDRPVFDFCNECTTFVAVGKSTKNGVTIIAKNRDLGAITLSELGLHVRQEHSPKEIYKAAYIDIPQVAETCKFIGSRTAGRWGYGQGINEYQVSVAANDAPTRDMLKFTKGLHDNDLIRLVLERSKTARESVDVIADLVSKYGIAWNGNIFEVGDPNEVWIIEIAGKRWVAKCYKDAILAFSNQYQITDDYDLAAPDLIDYAVGQDWVPEGTKKINFREIYSTDVLYPEDNKPKEAVYPLYNTKIRYERAMQLLESKDGEITVADMITFMRDHYDTLTLPSGKVIELNQVPYYSSKYANLSDLEWQVEFPKTDKVEIPLYFYSICNHNITGKTCSSVVLVSRPNIPDEIGGVMWSLFGQPCQSVYVPFYSGVTKLPEMYTTTQACVKFESIRVRAHGSYNLFEEGIRKIFAPFEDQTIKLAAIVEKEAVELIKIGKKQEAIKLITDFSDSRAMSAYYLINKVQDEMTKAAVNSSKWSR